MDEGTKTVCVDTCVIISLLKKGADRLNKKDIPILKGFLNDIHAGRVHVLFPSILRVELLECNLGKELMDEFELWTALPNFDELPVNTKVAKRASEIRNFYNVQHSKKEGAKLALADCVFIATAIEHDCPTLYTYDGDRLPPSKPRNLLKLKNPIAGKYPLHIQKPNTFQLGMA